MGETARAPVDVFEKARSHDRLEQLEAAKEHDLLPYFRLLTSQAGPVVEMEGRETIMLGSNNYLGLTGDERVKQAARDALETYGTGVTGSRLLNGTTPLHVELERELAEWMGTEDAIVYTTGYQSNLGLHRHDPRARRHGDLRLRRPRLDPRRLPPLRRQAAALPPQPDGQAGEDAASARPRTAAASSSSSTASSRWRATSATCRRSSSSARRYGARLMVDEAHGVGVLGARGAGACELFGLEDEVDLRMGTFSKSLASCGGFIAGPADVIEYLRIASRSFIFSASAVPAAVGAALGGAAGDPLRGARRCSSALLDNAAYLREGLRDLGLKVVEPGTLPDGTVATTPVVPVMVGDDWQAVLLWKALFDAGVYTNVAIHPAVPPGGALLRTSLMATHEREHLDGALGTIARAIADFPDLPRT